MRTQFIDTHIQVETGNDIFDKGAPRQLVRRHFPGKGVIWFEKSVTGRDLDRITDIDTAEHLEQDFSSGTDLKPKKVVSPSEF